MVWSGNYRLWNRGKHSGWLEFWELVAEDLHVILL